MENQFQIRGNVYIVQLFFSKMGPSQCKIILLPLLEQIQNF